MKLTASRFALLALSLGGLGPLAATAADRPVEVASAVAPKYPYLMRRAEATAKVTVLFKVDATGRVIDVGITDCNNPEFVAPTLEAARKWSFKPAIKDGKPVGSRVQETFVYSFRDQPSPDLAPAAYAAADRPAEIAEAVVPMYPHALQHAGVTAKVTVSFKVDATGQVTGVGIVDATDPDFIAPTLAAAHHWSFKPAIKDGKPVACRVQETFVYSFRDEKKFEALPQVRVTGKN